MTKLCGSKHRKSDKLEVILLIHGRDVNTELAVKCICIVGNQQPGFGCM